MNSRLKSLELHGYKTFASRTTFEFPGMVTAIVGPNGSGKSNIADSIRWVLGEQSFSLLRGRKTEDMIYNGSDLRPKAGMASASITFNNEDGWLPIDFSEVTVSRRAYRDGDNEYLLNGQRVRLKDISELLSKSGLAERTYTIIGQGLVDAALSLKPEERRRFFEEAAGIGLYRSRREEALTRLETTRRNLERVQDILGELGPRMLSLEKQARKAVEYERISADLRVLLRDWYGYHWHKVQQDVIHAAEVVRVQEAQNQAARDNLGRMDKETESHRSAIQLLRQAINADHEKLSALHQEQQNCLRQIDVFEERKKSMQQQAALLETEKVRLEEEAKFAQQKSEGLASELAAASQEAEEAKQEAAAAEAELIKLEAEFSRAQKEIQSVRQRMTGRQTEIVQKEARVSELRSRIEDIQRNLTARSEHISHLKDQNQTLKQTIHAEKEALAGLEAQIEQVLNEIHSRKKEIESLEQERKNTQSELRQIESDISRLAAQQEVLKTAEEEMTGIAEGARLFIKLKKEIGQKNDPVALARLLEVPREYEIAVAGALGELLDGVVLENSAEVEAALELVDQRELPRAVFLSLDWPAKISRRPSNISAGVCAADLIHLKGEHLSGLRRLLENVYIVENRKAISELALQLPPGTRIVTLKGEVFTHDGQIFAGKVSRLAAIARPREIRELSEKISELSQRREQLLKAFETCQRKIDDHEAAINKLTEEMNHLDTAKREKTRSIQAADLTYAQNESSIGAAEKEMVREQERVDNAAAAVKTLTEDVSAANREIATFEENIKKLNRFLIDIPVNETRNKANHWRTQLAVAERVLRDLKSREHEYKDSLASLQTLRAKTSAKLEELALGAAEIDRQIEELAEKSKQLAAQIADLDQIYKPKEIELTRLEHALETALSNQQTAQQAVTLSERRLAQAQLEMNRQRESLDSLKRRIEDDFGLVALEYNREVSGQTPLPLEGMVEMLPQIRELPADLEENIARNKSLLRRLGYVNLEAQAEYNEVKERHEYLTSQIDDLHKADQDLRAIIAELDELMKRDFKKTFTAVASEFKELFTRLFGGGSARLVLTDEDNPTEGGIDIEARLPGRREQGLSLLSGGERSLTAVALVFALLKVSPTPFCVLDEVDAMLDEANVGRFCELLKELSTSTQFIVITHNRNTVQVADVIYGITMGRDSASQMIGLRLDELSEEMVR